MEKEKFELLEFSALIESKLIELINNTMSEQKKEQIVIYIDFNIFFDYSDDITKKIKKTATVNRIENLKREIERMILLLERIDNNTVIKHTMLELLYTIIEVLLLKNSFKNNGFLFIKNSKDYNYLKSEGLNIYLDINSGIFNILNGDLTPSNNISFIQEFIFD